MSGRTTWWGKDAAWHRRELIVELGEEFGAEGPMVVDVLCSWAQEQRGGGHVRGGYRGLAREAFVTVGHAQCIVERAAQLGVLDDLEPDPDGRRFTCRVSGWESDQRRARAAARQAAKRNREPEQTPAVTPSHAESRSVTPSALPNQTIGGVGARAREPGLAADIDEVLGILGQCEHLFRNRVAIENAVVSWPGRDPVKAARTVVTWATDPAFRSTNAAKLLGDALSKQKPDAKAAGDAKADRTARRLRAVETLTNGEPA